jgi:tetratricopeptide (TPR) repeat protein
MNGMDVAGFIALLDRAELEMTPLEVAEVIWLARYAQSPHKPGEARPEGAGETSRSAQPAQSAEREEAEGGRPPEDAGEQGPRMPLYLPGPPGSAGRGLGWRSTHPVRVPASTALPGSLGLMRALRPLKRRAPDPRRRVLDEDATITAAAEAGVMLPVLRDSENRWLSLTFVVDTGAAMMLWNKLEAELLVLFQRLGAFRDLQTWYLRTDGGSVLGVSRAARPGSPGGWPDRTLGTVSEDVRGLSRRAVLRHTAELVDPLGRRLILLLSDGTSEAWYSGAMGGILRQWGARGSVAILQPLPQQLWPRTGLFPVPGRLTSTYQAAPNAALDFTPYGRGARWHQGQEGAGPVPVPVLELGQEWLRTWARFVAGAPGATLDCAVALAQAKPQSPAQRSRRPPAWPQDAGERVSQFAEQASPEALKLATYLSAAQLSLPVMRHVQQVMLPDSGPSHLAEVLLGGLISTSDAERSPYATEDWRYEFAPGVREVLLAGLTRSEARRVLYEVSRQLSARFGHAADEFTASLASPDPGAARSLSAASKPFAEIASRVLERITGRFPVGSAALGQPAFSSAGRADERSRLILRYQRTGALTDIDTAVKVLREESLTASAVGGGSPTPGHRSRQLRELALALRLRFSALGERSDLDEAEEALREAIASLSPGPQQAELLAELGAVYGLRYALTSEPADIDRAVSAAREAVGQAAPRTAESARCTGDLGGFLLRRAEAYGGRSDLDEAVSALRSSVSSAYSTLDAAATARLLFDLGTALRLRAASPPPRTEAGKDLDSAIAALEEAVALTSREGGQRSLGPRANSRDLASRLAGLGTALLTRGRFSDNANDLREAADRYREASAIAPAAETDRAERLASLGVALRELARHTRSSEDLTESIRSLRVAIAETPRDDPARPHRLADLAASLVTYFELKDNPGDLLEATYLWQEAAAGAPIGSIERAGYYAALAETCERSFETSGAERDLKAAESAYRNAVDTAAAADQPGWWLGRARVLTAMRRYDEAVQVLRDLSARLTIERGPGDRDTMTALFALAQALAQTGRPAEAAAVLDTLVPMQIRALGPDHADTQTSRQLRGKLG